MLDQEAEPDDLPAERLDQPAGRGGRAAGGEHVVDDEDLLAGVDRVAVDLELVGAVLELVLLADDRPRQLARLADRHEPGTQAIGDRRGEDEAARLDADDAVDGDVVEAADEVVDRPTEGGRVAEQRCDVAERDAGLGVVGDVSDVLAEPRRFGCHDSRYAERYRAGLSAALLLARARRVRQQAFRPVGRGRPSRAAVVVDHGSGRDARPRRRGPRLAAPGDPPTTRSRSVSPSARSVPFVGHFGSRCLKIASSGTAMKIDE